LRVQLQSALRKPLDVISAPEPRSDSGI
jgi:hypothetical protein